KTSTTATGYGDSVTSWTVNVSGASNAARAAATSLSDASRPHVSRAPRGPCSSAVVYPGPEPRSTARAFDGRAGRTLSRNAALLGSYARARSTRRAAAASLSPKVYRFFMIVRRRDGPLDDDARRGATRGRLSFSMSSTTDGVRRAVRRPYANRRSGRA